MSKHLDDQWKQLQQFKPPSHEKDQIKKRIWQTIQEEHAQKSPNMFLPLKEIITACLLVLISGSFFWLIFQESGEPQTAANPSIDYEKFSWALEDVYSKKADEGLELFQEKQSVPVGTVQEVTEEEMKTITEQLPMFVEEELEQFPYPTTMYIEHVKMMDTALRYHFFIPNKDKWIYFTFDYPKLEYAEIFHAMSTLAFEGKKPYSHDEQLYVNHGYGSMPFPVGLKPYSITSYKEIYYWDEGSNKAYSKYIETILASGWKKTASDGQRHTFVSLDGNVEISIRWAGRELIYEFDYPNREEE
ncbi:hypothetical protein [Cytobacillus massiliigabonensis]|uniref:hypothetical protein n=1 Tax=Cytobacillus massiliigabonensis TaxID=1871011 RepID=UPI000C826883|nr:hypothetical protein [Cytobacillus massiliigabonensis]